MCPFSPSRPGGGGASPRSAWALVAGAWLALFGVLALPAATQAQTGTTLVSNIGQGNTDSYTIRQSSRVMMFTTGSNMSRYILSNVEIVSVRDGIQPFDISLCTVTRGGQPTENCNILDRPGSFAAGTLSFGVPAAVTIYVENVAGPVGFVWHTLAPNTTHALLFNTPYSLDVGITTNDGEDAGHEEGWTIGNAYLREISGAGWVVDTSGRSFRIAIKGSAATATQDTQPLLSADATLSGLTLADGGGKAVALNETFAWDEKTYTADVASSVALVTVTPTTNHGRARVTYQDGSDTELSDADADADGQQVSLDVGANTIEVTVTAEDGSTDETYTATVTRAVMAPPKNLAAVAVAPTRVELEWDRTMPSPKGLDHRDFPGYRIEGSDSSNGPWTSLVNVTNQYGTFDIWCVCYPTRFNDNTIAPGTTRYYRVQAVDGDEASAYSNVVSATTTPLVDSDQGRVEFGAVVSEFDSLNDQKVFQFPVDQTGESYRFTIGGKATRHRVIVTDPFGTEIWNDVLEANNNLEPRFTTQTVGLHQVKISHGGSPGNFTSLNAGWFQFVLVPERDPGLSELSLPTGFGEGALSTVLNTYGDVDRLNLFVQPGKAYAVRIRGRSGDDTTYGTAETPRIERARPPSTTHEYDMGKPWVPGVTTAKSSTICHGYADPTKCEFQAFVIDLRGQTGPQQTWRIDVTPTARSGTWPYRVGIYSVHLDELSAGDLAGVRMPLRAWFASQPAQHDGSKAIKVRVAFSDAVEESPEDVGAHGVEVEGGEVTSVSAVGGDAPDGAGTRKGSRSAGGRNAGEQDREVVWEFAIEPDSDGDLTVTLEAGRPCGEPGAICTADGRVLSQGISTTVRGTDEASAPLTASFKSMPEAHDGESVFRFRVAFSENIGISFRSLREDAFTVTGGRVTRGKRVDDRRDLFEMTVEPDGEGEVTVTLPAGRECSVSGAICTKGENRRQLTNAPTATVAGPAVETGPAGLTARFARVPSEHDGTTAFKLRIAFSEEIRMSGRRLRSDVVAVAGGRATRAGRVNRRKDLWKLKVRPDSLADVTVTLAAGAACDSPGAVCMADGRALSNTISTVVRGPVAVSVADARVREAAGATLDFAVRLSRAAAGTVSVTWATADGTATAGEDYRAGQGKLRFAPGETEKTISVPVLDDAHDEGEETMRLRLTAASGAAIADGVATGTIENSDPIPQAWLARFGRTVAGHVTDAIADRLTGPAGGGSHVTLGGRRLSFGGHAPDVPDATGPEAADGLTAFADRIAAHADGGAWQRREPGASRSLTGRELLLGSSFRLAPGGGDAGTGWTAWGRAAQSRFDGDADGLALDGDVTTFTLGADAAGSRWLAGVALAHSTGEGGYRDHAARAGHPDLGSGTLESALTSVHPYARYRAGERLTLWGMLGYGAGDLTLTMKGRDGAPDTRIDTDTGFRMAAAGARGVLVAAGDTGGFELAGRTDAQLVRTTSEKTDGLAATTADTSRLRLVLEGSRRMELAGGQTLTPTLEVGLRHDGGDAETGAGIEAGGGVRYADPALGLTAQAKARTLIAHEDSDYREWGASGSVRIDPGASGRGLSLTLAPAWGAASGGADRLWSLRDARAFAANDAFDPAGHLDAEAGYGLGAFGGRGLMMPYAGLALFGDGRARVAHRRSLDPRAGRRVRRRGHARRARQRRPARARPRLPRDAALVSGAAITGTSGVHGNCLVSRVLIVEVALHRSLGAVRSRWCVSHRECLQASRAAAAMASTALATSCAPTSWNSRRLTRMREASSSIRNAT